MKTFDVLLLPLSLAACAAPAPPPPEKEPPGIDERSYNLGGIGAFAEVVGAGVKKLALSAPLAPAEMDALIEEAERIVERNHALSYRETDFLTTDLFPAEVTNGKHVLLIYTGSVKDEYMALKQEKKALVDQNRYEGEARSEIARKMGKLLSYSDEKIETLLAGK
jgi:hypothetical protein